MWYSSISSSHFGRPLAHLLSPLKFHTTSDKRCGTSSHLWPGEWLGTFQGGLDLYGHGHIQTKLAIIILLSWSTSSDLAF